MPSRRRNNRVCGAARLHPDLLRVGSRKRLRSEAEPEMEIIYLKAGLDLGLDAMLAFPQITPHYVVRSGFRSNSGQKESLC
ncbi:MAG: hypothetical protein WCL49_09705 [bacterium]